MKKKYCTITFIIILYLLTLTSCSFFYDVHSVNVKVIVIFDEPFPPLGFYNTYVTIGSCLIESKSECRGLVQIEGLGNLLEVDIAFDHRRLPNIGIYEGAIISITYIDKPVQAISPHIRNVIRWEIIE